MAEINNAKVIVDYADMQAIASAIKNRTGSTEGITITEMPTQIGGIVGGVELPELTNEGAASDLLSGKQLIDGEGNIVEGTIATKTASNLSASGATVTVPAGYYATQVSKAVATATQATPSITINASGLITATHKQTTSGYITAGTKSATKQLAFQAAKTITPTTTSQIAVSSGYYTGGSITVKGDSNLVAKNIKSGVSIFGVNGTYVGSGSGSSGDNLEVEIIEGTLTTYENSKVTKIRDNAFYECSGLTLVSFPICTSIGTRAFQGCTNLTSISFPNCSYIGNYAFDDCTSLTSISFPNCSYIGNYAFTDCYKLTSVNFPNCSYIDEGVFESCTRLISINFPICTSINNYAFKYCISLTSVNFPNCSYIACGIFESCRSLISASFPVCTSINNYAFTDCTSLTSINFPACLNINSGAFTNCYKLTSVSFPACFHINSDAFHNCSSLTSIYLMGYSICALFNSNAFYSTAITSSTGFIYVPTSLVTSYKTATNWTYFSNRIFGNGESEGGNSSSTSTINFTINGTEYQAEEGMTWGEWCSSGYNIDGFNNEGDIVDPSWIGVVMDEVGTPVTSSDIIVSGAAYSY